MKLLEIKEKAESMKKYLGLTSSPVGVSFIFSKDYPTPSSGRQLNGYRYCQALMEARRGNHVILDKEGISCPAAAAAFGFKPLPPGLQSGKGLTGFGITKGENTGKTMFEEMTVLEQGELKELYLFPLESAVVVPDVVVVEDEVEKLMWIALARLNAQAGRRIESSTAVLQATCVDATLIPFVEKRFNLSFGCYGCRDATDIGTNETVLGFPFEQFEEIVSFIEYLDEKAIPNSRGKNAFTLLQEKAAQEIEKNDPFA